MKIIAARKKSDIDVQFLDKFGYVKKHMTFQKFKRGEIKNPYDKTIYEMGYIGVGEYVSWENGKIDPRYSVWQDMCERCYSKSMKDRHPTYYGVVNVCEEWLNYQNFAKWFDENSYDVVGRLHLDKDILVKDNKMYAPDRCLLVPQRINMLFLSRGINKYGLPEGIKLTQTKKYSVSYQGKNLGNYMSLQEACSAYVRRKEEVIKLVADEYKDIIPSKVYKALYDYKVDNKFKHVA